jgi:hypothetical protein
LTTIVFTTPFASKETRAEATATPAAGRQAAATVIRASPAGTGGAAHDTSVDIPAAISPAGRATPRRISRCLKIPRARQRRALTVPTGRLSRRATASQVCPSK